MKIERYISLLAVLAVGLFLVNATFAEDQTPNSPNYLQCYAPANIVSVPAGAGIPGTVCTTCVPASSSANTQVPAENQTPNSPNCLQCYAPVNTWSVPATSGTKAPAPAVKHSETPWEVLGSILATPFVIGQCIFEGCP